MLRDLIFYIPNLVEISWLAPEICAQNGIRENGLLPVPTLMPAILWGPLRQQISELGGPTPTPGWYSEVRPPSALDRFFRIPKKSSSLKWRRSEQECYENLGQNLALFAPVKIGEGWRYFCEFFSSLLGTSPTAQKRQASIRSINSDVKIQKNK